MFDFGILFPAVLNGLTTGAVYALVALGLTLIYGVLHIINFAHGAALMLALYAVYLLKEKLGVDPYLALVAVVPAMFALPKLIAFAGALVVSVLLMLLMVKTDLGRAIRAVAKEKQGARLMGIDVEHVYAMSFGIGLACLGAAACFLMPAYYVNPQVGSGFVLVAFTIVVLGGMGSFAGALVGGLLIGVVESLGGLYFGESLGQIGIFLLFIAVLLFRPQGLFGAKA